MKKLAFALMLATISLTLFSQNFEVPQNPKLDKPDDFARYEQDVIKCFDWLMDTPIDEQKAKRMDASSFLLKWLSGSPDVHIMIKEEIVTFLGSTPDLLMVFMGGWAKYSLESKDFDNRVAGNLAGIEAVIAFYQKNRDSLPKDKNVEKYIKMKEKGKLKEYIEKNA